MNDLKQFIQTANKELGDNTAVLVDEDFKVDVDVIPTGIDNVDKAMGVGGFPRGKISEVFGKEGSGKTTLCLHAIAQAHKMGLNCAFIDTEHAINFERMKALGVDTGKLVFSQPQSGEEALNLVEMMVRDGRFAMIVVDSVAALIPQVEVEKDMGESVMGVHARLMSQAMRKLTAPTNKSNTALVFVNQTRSKIGVMWGNPETTTGGVALKFYASMRIRMAYTGKVTEGKQQVASKGKVQIVKNKLAVPFKEAEFTIGEYGIDGSLALIQDLVAKGILVKSGSFYKYEDEVIAQGGKALMDVLREKPELKEKLVEALHKQQ